MEAEERPVYQTIAGQVMKLSRLGMRKSVIARQLGVDAKTVAKAISLLE